MRKLFDLQHPFFRPLWIRIVTTAACLGWGVFELSSGNAMWSLLFFAIGLYCAYEFMFGPPQREKDEKEDEAE